jgi:hypothetical protein
VTQASGGWTPPRTNSSRNIKALRHPGEGSHLDANSQVCRVGNRTATAMILLRMNYELRHTAFEALVVSSPIRKDPIEKRKEPRPMVRFGYVAKFVGDDVVDAISWSLDQSEIEEKPRRRGH